VTHATRPVGPDRLTSKASARICGPFFSIGGIALDLPSVMSRAALVRRSMYSCNGRASTALERNFRNTVFALQP